MSKKMTASKQRRYNRSRYDIRKKVRSRNQAYSFEIRTPDVISPHYNPVWPMRLSDETAAQELNALCETVRNMVGQYKIIQCERRAYIKTKILLKNEADIFLLTVAHPTMIRRIYAYSDACQRP